jgi:hypothetical protein
VQQNLHRKDSINSILLNDSDKSEKQPVHEAVYEALDRILPSSKGFSVISTQQTADGGLSLLVYYCVPI